MTVTVILAAAAGVAGACGLVELARVPRRSRPDGLRRMLRAMGARVVPHAAPLDLRARVAAAGARIEPSELMAVKAGAAVAGLLAAAPLTPILPGRLGWVAPPAVALIGFMGPDLVLTRRARRRHAAITGELPDVADLLRVAIEAGLPTRRALAEVARRHEGVLARELRCAVGALEMGAPRHRCLARLHAGAPPGLTALLEALERAETLGSPPGEALQAIAVRVRADRARATAEAAARAAPQIQLVVALLLVPSVMLLVAAALIPALTR